ncbi:MAG: hypothetical protein JXA04_12110 [Gammaproteobacteria bacterium]|nr:hypothetical protein [Gammaproteobacteria bacterium]
MTDESQESQAEVVAKLQAFILEQVKAGADQNSITNQMKEMGVEETQARELVDTLYTHIMQAAKNEEYTHDALFPALFGAILTAVIGGAIWAAVVVFTGYEVGFVAWGLGFLSGAAVVFFTGGKKGTFLQILAVISSIAGIVIGKYAMFYYYVTAETSADLSVFSPDVFNFFIENASSLFGGYDVLWVVFAVYTAWRIPQGMGIKPKHYLSP